MLPFYRKKTSASSSLEHLNISLSSVYVIGSYSLVSTITFILCVVPYPKVFEFLDNIPIFKIVLFIKESIFYHSESWGTYWTAFERNWSSDYFQSQENKKDANDPTCGHLRFTSTRCYCLCPQKKKKQQ